MASLPGPPAPDAGWAWFFDIDGTLIELADEPASLEAGPHLPAFLEHLYHRFGGAMALVSGRTLSNILCLTAPFRLPSAGCHGAERLLADGRILRMPPSQHLARARGILSRFAAAHPDLVFEDKDTVLSLHFRKAPHLETVCRAVVEQAASGDLGWIAGKMVFEIKSRAFNKGSAVQSFLESQPFRGRMPVFVGDDLPDEDAFDAVRRRGGFGVLVGALRPTKALYRLESVSSVHGWLGARAF